MLRKLSTTIENEPLLAGVEDNPIYRLLSKRGKWRRSNIQVYHKNGIDQFFYFHDWAWNDLDVTPLTARDYAQALWAVNVGPTRKPLISYLIISIAYIALITWLSCLSFIKTSFEYSGAYLVPLFVFGYLFFLPTEPAIKIPLLIYKAKNTRSFIDFLAYALIAILILICEGTLVFYPAKSLNAIILKNIVGGLLGFSIGVLGAWVMIRFIRPSRKKLFEKLTGEIEILLQERRDSRELERQPQK